MTTTMTISFGCYFLAILIMAATAATYLFRSEFMPFHSVAIGMPWSEVSYPFRVLMVASMKVIGCAWLACVFFQLILLFMPFRQGLAWARWALPIGALISSAGAFYAMIYTKRNTPAKPPLGLFLFKVALVILGFVFSLL
ncbi:MAG: hypothetical protein ACLP9S_00460 [Syntrophales bacterium]